MFPFVVIASPLAFKLLIQRLVFAPTLLVWPSSRPLFDHWFDNEFGFVLFTLSTMMKTIE